MKKIIPALFLFLLPLSLAAENSKRLSAEVLWQLQRVGAPVVSPDGNQVVVPVTTYPEDGGDANSQLWLLSVDGDIAQHPLTSEEGSASDPVFSPDGSRLAFVRKMNKEDAPQIYAMPMRAPGEAIKLTDVPTGVSAIKWAGEHIYFASNVWPEMSFDEMKEKLAADKDSKLSAKVWNEMPYSYWDSWLAEDRQNHLYRIPDTGGEIEALTLPIGTQLARADVDASDYDVSPDGTTLAFVADGSDGGIYPNEDIFLSRIGSGRAKNITEDNSAPDDRPMFSPDGRALEFSRQRIEGFYADQVKLMLHEVRSGRSRMLHRDWDRSAEGLAWAADSKGFYGAIDDEGMRRVYYLPLDGDAPSAITDKTDYGQLSVARNGTVIAQNQSAVYPARIVSIDSDRGKVRRLDAFNDAILAEVSVGTRESVTYAGADGAPIQMWVHYPPEFDRDKEYPLFLLIHGGPHGAVTDDFHYRWNAQTFASWGYVTAWPNFHGSTGFGQAFADSINPDWASKPYADVIAAAEWLMEKPWIDADRTVAGGGSYGGYLSSILLGREHPFNALMIHAAVYDLYAQTSADFAVHEQRFGPYWEKPEIYEELSPHMYADRFDTPSLIIHGQRDLRVPVGQAFELFRALQTRGVESRLVYYPDENHWILTRTNSLHWYGEVRQWVERYAAPGPK
ncbi:MAG: S9 family peptidase [Gammaproteobacteria bacterium]|nr:S9 family peptidase [Gammaproteobacteria bacterium]